MDLVYKRLGHFNKAYIYQLANGLATSLTLTTKRLAKKYTYYIIGQVKVLPFLNNIILTRLSRLFEIIYIDLLEAPISILGTSFKYL